VFGNDVVKVLEEELATTLVVTIVFLSIPEPWGKSENSPRNTVQFGFCPFRNLWVSLRKLSEEHGTV
jgi:hypothetical protein